MVVHRDLWEYHVAPICNSTITSAVHCVSCSPGFYRYKFSCLPCGPGFYSDDFGEYCLPWFVITNCNVVNLWYSPRGFYSQLYGANTFSLCLPCDVGFYNDLQGQSSCKPCPRGYFCRIGTEIPTIIQDFQNDTSHSTVISTPIASQPVPLEKKDGRNRILNVASFSASFGFFLLFLIPMTCFSRTAKKQLKWWDMFKLKHYQVGSRGPVMIRKTVFGAIMTFRMLWGKWIFVLLLTSIWLVYYGICAAFFVSTLVPFFDDNYQESRSLIPNLAAQRKNFHISTSLSLSITLIGHSCGSGCVSEAPMNGLLTPPSGTKLECRSSSNDTNRMCTAVFNCNSCWFSNLDTASVCFKFNSPNTYALGYRWNVAASSSYSGQFSKLEGTIISEATKLFRGINNPTVVNIQAYQTTFRSSAKNTMNTGWHVDFASATIGDQVASKNFSHTNGAYFCFQLLKMPTTLEVEHEEKKSWPVMLTYILSSVTGFVNLVAGVLSRIERVQVLVNRIVRWCQFKFGRNKKYKQVPSIPPEGKELPNVREEDDVYYRI